MHFVGGGGESVAVVFVVRHGDTGEYGVSLGVVVGERKGEAGDGGAGVGGGQWGQKFDGRGGK